MAIKIAIEGVARAYFNENQISSFEYVHIFYMVQEEKLEEQPV